MEVEVCAKAVRDDPLCNGNGYFYWHTNKSECHCCTAITGQGTDFVKEVDYHLHRMRVNENEVELHTPILSTAPETASYSAVNALDSSSTTAVSTAGSNAGETFKA